MPILAELALPFFVFAAAIVLIGIARTHTAVHGSQHTSGVWQWLTGVAELKFLFGLASKATAFVASYFAASQLKMLAKWLTAMGTLTSGWFAIEAAFAEAVVHAIERVMHRGDPRARSKAQIANRHAIHAGHAATHANAHAGHVAHALNHYKAHTNPQIRHLVHATTIALPRDIGRVKHRERWAERQLWKVRDRVKGLEDGAIKTWDWIRTHPYSAATGAFTAAVAVAIDALGGGGIRCPEFGNLFKKRGCGMWNALDKLIPLGIFLTIGFDFPAFVSAARLVATGIGDGVAKIEGAFDVSLPALPPPTVR